MPRTSRMPPPPNIGTVNPNGRPSPLGLYCLIHSFHRLITLSWFATHHAALETTSTLRFSGDVGISRARAGSMNLNDCRLVDPHAVFAENCAWR